MILAIETATDVCSVIFSDEHGQLSEKRLEKKGSHSEQLFLFIQDLMNEHQFSIADLEALLISEGPGSYTGLRISASAVKGLLFQTDVPLYSINTLASFAMQVSNGQSERTIHSVIDARRKHLYYQPFNYQNGNLKIRHEVEVLAIEKIEQQLQKGDVIVGTGINRISKERVQGLQVYGMKAISAKSLIQIYRNNQDAFFQKANPEIYDPKYYTSNQT